MLAPFYSAFDHREARDPGLSHALGQRTQRFVGICDHRIGLYNLGQGDAAGSANGMLAQQLLHVTASQDAHQSVIVAHHGVEILSTLAFRLESLTKIGKRNLSGKSYDVGAHRLARANYFERINGILST